MAQRQELAHEWMTAEERKAAVAEAKAGLSMTFPRIGIVGGGAAQFEMPEGDTVKSFSGVVLYRHPARSYWESEPKEGEPEPPTCFSVDGVLGSLKRDKQGRFGPCESCKFSQWGSNPKGGKGQACRLKDRLFVLLAGQEIPHVFLAPPTSIKAVSAYIGNLLATKADGKQLFPFSVETEFALSKVSRGQMKWSVLSLRRARVLADKEAAAMWGLKQRLMSFMQQHPLVPEKEDQAA